MKKNYYKKPKSVVKIFGMLIASALIFNGCSSDDDPQPNNPDPDPLPEEQVELPPILLECDYFSEDRVLVNDTLRPVDYVISCWANVEGALKIEAGVVIEFENHAGLRVDLDNNVFEIKGTATEPVILSGTSKQDGYWRGIFLTEAHNPNNIIEHTVIEYAGSQNFTSTSPVYEGSLALRGVSSTPPQALTLNHVVIRNGGSVGLDYHRIETNATVSTSNLVITGNDDVPVKVSAVMAHVFNNTSSYTGNASDFLNITDDYGTIENKEVNWQKLDVPYLVDSRVFLKSEAHLTIEAGVEMQFKSGAYLQPYGDLPPYNVSLKILGTAAEPVHLKAHNGTNWGGIMYGFTQDDNIIDHAIIEHAKGDFPVGNINNSGAIYLHARPKLTISNTVFKDLQNCAFYGYGTNPFENLSESNVTFENVAAEFCDD